jgi:hypothetical protein
VAIDQLKQLVKRKYPWVGAMYMTGRGPGWFAVEDPKGKMTKAKLKEMSQLVEAERRQFIKDMEEAYPRARAAR